MKIIIYGVGTEFSQIFEDKAFIEKKLLEKGIDIVGFSDGSQAAWGRIITYNGKAFKVNGIQGFTQAEIDEIWVASKAFYDEIKETLLQKGYLEQQILSLYDVYRDSCFPEWNEEKGIEIGGPTELFSNIYQRCRVCDGVNFSSTTVWWENETQDYSYQETRLGDMYIADAVDMKIVPSQEYDFLLSSNNLEHIANPLKALKEFSRVLKPGGNILILVPIKEKTFDHNRESTTFEHLLDDFKRDVGEDDMTHLPEIIEKHDYNMDPACGGKETFILRAQKNIENRCLHHHVFEEAGLRKSLEFAGFEVLSFGRILTNWFIVGRKQ